MPLDISMFEKAVQTAENSLKAASTVRDIHNEDDFMAYTIRAGVIQSFEYTFELAHKTMRKWLKYALFWEESEASNKDVFRSMARRGLIDNPEDWIKYLDARNLSSHTYNQDNAVQVYEVVEGFLKSAKDLAQRIKSVND